MLGFSTSELAMFRADTETIFSDVALVTPPTKGDVDSTGAAVVQYLPRNAVEYACLITEASPRAYQIFGDAIQPGTLFRFRLPYGTGIDADSRVVVNGKTYRVAKPDSNVSYNITDGLYLVLQDPA